MATKDRFFIDGMLRGDFYQNNLNDPLVSGIFNQKLDARGLAFSGNVGYNIPLQNNWFIEPSAGIVVSKVKVDPLNVTGTGLAAVIAGGVVGTFPGQLRISDINSTLARLSVRGGTTIASGNMIWQPFVTLSVYHEFQGNITSSFDGLAVTQFTGVRRPAGRPGFHQQYRHLRPDRRRRLRPDRQHRLARLCPRRLSRTATTLKATA